MYRILKLNESAKLKEAEEFRYITNHGIGPGTLPDGVYIRSEDLEHGKTAIYLNRPLTAEELEKSWGYVDHSEDYKSDIEEIIETDEGLLSFLFNDNNGIQGGNDNC